MGIDPVSEALPNPDAELRPEAVETPSGAAAPGESGDPLAEQASERAAEQGDSGELSSLALAAAGLSCINILLSLALIGFWLVDSEAALELIQTAGGLTLLLGFGAIAVGGWFQRTIKQGGGKAAGALWATAALLSGMTVTSLAILLPLISAVQSFLSPPGA